MKVESPREARARLLGMGEGLRRQGRVLLNALFPRCCEGCGEELGAEDPELCWSCLADLPRIQAPFCSVCGHPVEGRVDHGYVCSVCTRQERDFVMARSALHYRGMSQDLVLAFKYRQAIWLRRFFFDCLDACAGAYFQGEPVSAGGGGSVAAAPARGGGVDSGRTLAGRSCGRG
ncbi:MAG TPA: double zinc ribbon domain-containing protein, partial [Kiritimatiellia bacterium]|nr:double zinc ribbon domain-containing protein [Kiritimatiellia bacterium]